MSKYKIFLLGKNDLNEGVKCVDNDIKSMASFFRNYNYDVHIGTSLNEYDLIGELANYIKDLTKEDVFIFYYAGHSILQDQSLFLYINGEEIDFNVAINRELQKQKKIKNVLFLFDSCSSGKINSFINTNINTFRAITATNHTEHAIEMNQENANNFEIQETLGFFTYFLLISIESLFENNKEISVNDLGTEIELQISNYNDVELPEPQVYGKNNFIFIAKHDCKTIISTFYEENFKKDFKTFLNSFDIKIKQCLLTDCNNRKILSQLIKICSLQNLTPESKKQLLKTINNEIKKCL